MKQCLIPALLWIALGISVKGDVIYDNSANDLAVRFNPGLLQVGDEITLAGSARYLTNFSFEYWGTNTAATGNPAFSGDVQSRVRFYLNDGPAFNDYPSPSSIFFDSDWFTLPTPTPRSTLVFTAGDDFPAEGLFIPASKLTWTVQFKGMSATDLVGVDLYSPAVTGASFGDYWENSGTGWALKTNVVAMDFAARMAATFQASSITPRLEIFVSGAAVTVRWPLDAANYTLQTAPTLEPNAVWTSITNNISISGQRFSFTTNTSPGAAFFRLQRN